MPKSGAKVLTDLKELRALAHPVRAALLTELSSRGEAAVTELATAVGEPVNAASFHLRLLARYGFVERAPHGGRDRREHWWRLVYEDGFDWDRLLTSSVGAGAARSQLGKWLDSALERIRSYFSSAVAELPSRQSGAFTHDWYLQLTAEEAEEFDQDYRALCARWRERTQDLLGAGEVAGREQFGIFIFGFPLSEES
jgi:DNA-binding transcriptional ArsR family regulator